MIGRPSGVKPSMPDHDRTIVADAMIGKIEIAASADMRSCSNRISETLVSRFGVPRRPPPITTVPLAICLNDKGLPIGPPTTASQKWGIRAVTSIIGATASIGAFSPSWRANSPAQAPAQLRR